MILKTENGDVIQTKGFEGKNVELSLEDSEKILYMLSQGNYKFPRHSALRESVKK